MIDIKYPNITSTTDRGQLEQVRAYLYQLADQLKFALNTIDGDVAKILQKYQSNQEKNEIAEEKANELFCKKLAKELNKKVNIKNYDGLDFNSILFNSGIYISEKSPQSAESVNYPVDEMGMLEVISAMKEISPSVWYGCTYQNYRTHTGLIYTRSYFSSTGWTAWKQVTLT
jgi:hypothetical protein